MSDLHIYRAKREKKLRPRWPDSPLLILLGLIIVACNSGSSTTSTPTRISGAATTTTATTASGSVLPAAANAIILDMLNNVKTHGYNPDPGVNHGRGGLWINWRYAPYQTNMNGSGAPDDNSDGSTSRHDPLTDIRYVHALWLYKNLHPKDTQFDSEITRYTAMLKYEFATPQNDRGWLYDIFSDLYQLSHDVFYKQTAYSLASYFYTNLYHPATEVIYKIKPGHPYGSARVDQELTVGCALIQAGATFNEPAWKAAGEHIVQTVYTTAYLSQYHVIATQVDNVLLPDGRLNPDPTFFHDMYGHTKVDGGEIRLGSLALEALSLLHAYSATQDQTLLEHALDLLTPLTSDQNLLGLWDTRQQGYFASATFPGPDVQHPGAPQINRTVKESGRQLQMLEAFHIANSFTKNSYQKMQDAMLDVLLKKAYYAPGHGVLYQETPDWQLVRSRNGQPQDWVTSEAIGIALESLFSLTATQPH